MAYTSREYNEIYGIDFVLIILNLIIFNTANVLYYKNVETSKNYCQIIRIAKGIN